MLRRQSIAFCAFHDKLDALTACSVQSLFDPAQRVPPCTDGHGVSVGRCIVASADRRRTQHWDLLPPLVPDQRQLVALWVPGPHQARHVLPLRAARAAQFRRL